MTANADGNSSSASAHPSQFNNNHQGDYDLFTYVYSDVEWHEATARQDSGLWMVGRRLVDGEERTVKVLFSHLKFDPADPVTSFTAHMVLNRAGFKLTTEEIVRLSVVIVEEVKFYK